MPSTWTKEKYIAALRYAAAAHNGQKVPGSELPYVVHVTIVAMEIIAALGIESGLNGDLAVQCALLHDVLEDTAISRSRIQAIFGKDVADGVLALTKDDSLPSKEERIEDSLGRIKIQPKEVWMVKMADRITNLQPPPANWSKGKRVYYRQEAVKIHKSLRDASRYLAKRLEEKIERYKNHFI